MLSEKPYTTQAEIEFIDGIGRGKWAVQEKHTRLELLEGYMVGLRKRLNFDDINEEVAIQHCHEAILEEKRI